MRVGGVGSGPSDIIRECTGLQNVRLFKLFKSSLTKLHYRKLSGKTRMSGEGTRGGKKKSAIKRSKWIYLICIVSREVH